MSEFPVEAPAVGEEFFDRVEETGSIIHSILRGEHLVIIGHRKVGKTSILFRVGDELSGREYIFAYTYIPEASSVELVANEFMRSVLSALAGESRIIPVREYVRIAIRRFPRVSSEILTLSELKPNESVFRDALVLLDNILEKIGMKAIVVFDEFQNIANISLGILDYIRQALWRVRRIIVILCGSMIRMIDRILSRPSMPLGLRRIKIEPFDFNTAREFMMMLSKKAIPETILAFIYAITGGMPFHIKVLLRRINSIGVEKISWWVVRKALLEELLNDSGVLYNYYSAIESRLESLSAIYLEILYAIAMGKRRLSEIARFLGKSMQDINYYVKRLREMEIIDEDNIILDEMFEIWMETAWPVVKKAPVPELERRRKIFLQAIDGIIEQYKSMLGWTVESIIYELIKKMRGETISGEKMPNPVEVLRNIIINNEEFDILAIKNNNAWIIEICTHPLTKEDVVNFEKKTKVIRGYNIKGKILVALSTISHDAISKATQLRIKIWTREFVKKLMRYYKIPVVSKFFS